MTRVGVVLCLVLSAGGAMGAGDPLVGRVEGKGASLPEGYVPPLISNGDLNMLVEWTGGQSERSYYRLEPMVYWQGRRGPAREAELFGFGRFMPTMSVDGKDAGLPARWSQTLDIAQAEVVCEGSFSDGINSRIEIFCAIDRNVVALRRKVTNEGNDERHVVLDLDYRMTEHDRLIGAWQKGCLMRTYHGTTYGHRVIDFDIRITAADQDAVRRTFVLKPGETATMDWFITFSDSYEEKRTAVPQVGWDELFAVHTRGWKSYYDESYVRLPDARLQRMYDVQQYHLRCNATRWGFPVGIFPHHWQGKYFGFDEMYMHDGLVSAGHFDIARRCPAWRQAVIPMALKRQSHYNAPGKYGARWLWMSLEDGDVETASIGFWMDHIFAMGTIAKSAWTQYTYSGDRDYLERTGYQIVQECARFYRNNWILEDGEKAYIGRCTDLERLGPSRDKAFLTTCSAIYSLRVAAEACEILKTNLVEAADFRATASRLEKGLPTNPDGSRFVAYENCTEESVGTLGGLYPFPLYDATNARQKAAAWHFIRAGQSAGNMYPMGNKVCPWYAAKMSAAMTALGDRVEPYRWLSEAAGAIGLFGETWEINEPDLRIHPWFTTASGNCVFAVNEMLIRGTYPQDWKTCSFRLPDGKGGWIEKAQETALLTCGGAVTDKTPGWRFEASTAKGGVYFNALEGYYPDKGGKLVSARVKVAGGRYYRLTFDARAKERGYEAVNFYDGEGKWIADNYDVVYAGERQHYDRVVYAMPGTAELEVFFQSKSGLEAWDVAVEEASIANAAEFCDRTYAKIPQLAFKPEGNPLRLAPKTLDALKTGRPWRMLLLGDSIVQDTYHSQFSALVQRLYPEANVTWLVSVRGSTGCWFYQDEKNFADYVTRHRPDCVMIGGISNWIHPDLPLNGAAAIEVVANRIVDELKAEVIVMTPTLSYDLRDPESLAAWNRPGKVAFGEGERQELTEICRRRSWPFWDLYTPAYDWLTTCDRPINFYSRDQVHSGELGKQLIARLMEAYFAADRELRVP